MRESTKRYKNARDFGHSLGLNEVDMELIHQKKRLIEELKKARQKRKLSQAELAKRVSSQQPAIARMESGQVSEVSMDFLLKVAIALQVSVSIRPFEDAA